MLPHQKKKKSPPHTQTDRRDSTPSASWLAVAVHVSMSQSIPSVAGVLDVIFKFIGIWVL